MKTLTRSKRNRIFLGVCGGIGEYLNIDPTIIRIIWALFALTGAGILFYLLCGFIIPENTDSSNQFYYDRDKRSSNYSKDDWCD